MSEQEVKLSPEEIRIEAMKRLDSLMNYMHSERPQTIEEFFDKVGKIEKFILGQ
jgi:hypothetical protein